jgi:hypothetical protein
MTRNPIFAVPGFYCIRDRRQITPLLLPQNLGRIAARRPRGRNQTEPDAHPGATASSISRVVGGTQTIQ